MKSELNSYGSIDVPEDVLYRHEYLVEMYLPKRRRKGRYEQDRKRFYEAYDVAGRAVDQYLEMKKDISRDINSRSRSRVVNSVFVGDDAFRDNHELSKRLGGAYCSVRRSLGIDSMEDYYFTKRLGRSWITAGNTELKDKQISVYGSIYKHVMSTKRLDENNFLDGLKVWTNERNGRTLHYDSRGHLAAIHHNSDSIGAMMEQYYSMKPICFVLEYSAFEDLISHGFITSSSMNHCPTSISGPRVIDQGILVVEG